MLLSKQKKKIETQNCVISIHVDLDEKCVWCKNLVWLS